ncbi:MAG: DUF1801 domain-containing protein [Sphingobacteriaceae bacterium]|nr:MAG: DUF1801 domain-containing protein [Sphingobacteriaceae bacterium]
MATQKTTETNLNVIDFINTVADEQKRNDSLLLVDIFKQQTGFEPKMWGPSIIGFGSYHYKYHSGHEGDAPRVGFSPRKDAISLYLMCDFAYKDELLNQLGKYKTAKACIYIKKVSEIDIDVLRRIISACVNYMDELYPAS